MNKTKIVFFGGEPLGVPALNALRTVGIMPDLIVCSPDRRAGRGLTMTSPAVKTWAIENNIETFQPLDYKDETVKNKFTENEWHLFIVVAYNFILPQWLLKLPTKGTINMHPSLLPKLRGPSPIRTAILHNTPEYVGVSVMLLDEKMDHGPILTQAAIQSDEAWPISGPDLDETLAASGGYLLAETVPAWLAGEITPKEQDHAAATYTHKFVKGDNELNLNISDLPTGTEALSVLCKIRAWSGIGDTFFIHNGKRVKVKTADLTASGSLALKRVIPEGKKEMDFSSYLQSLTTT